MDDCLLAPPRIGWMLVLMTSWMREIWLLLRNTIIVTAAVILGLVAAEWLGFSSWMTAFCLLPAIYLYFWLARESPPVWWKVAGFLAVLAAFAFVLSELLPGVSERYQTLAFLLIVWLTPLSWRKR